MKYPSYEVSVKKKRQGSKLARLSPARKEDMPSEWDFDWPQLWEKVDPDCQSIIKLEVGKELWGLIRYGLYPYPPKEGDSLPLILLVDQIESHPSRNPKRSRYKPAPPQPPGEDIKPVGRWLLWYACTIALRACHLLDDQTLVALLSKPGAVEYYKEVIGMTQVDSVPISDGGEELYGFSFDADQAEDFCSLQQLAFGKAQAI